MNDMKAWIITMPNEWVGLFHGDTAGKAKTMALNVYGYAVSDYTSLTAKRFPELDNAPFTYLDCKSAGFMYTDDWDSDWQIGEDEFANDCTCPICKGRINVSCGKR